MVKPRDFFRKHSSLYLDTSIFIYFIEKHPRYYSLCESVFRGIEEGQAEAFTSTLSLLEILVQPYRLKRDDLVLKFYSLLTTYPHLTWLPLTLTISDQAAKLRAEYNLKTPDAIHLASALSSNATAFICNDKALSSVKEIECLVLDEYM